MPSHLKPWSILSSESTQDFAPWLIVDSLKVRVGSSQRTIDNFIQRTTFDSCLIVPFINQEQVLVVRQYKLAIGKALIEFPAGYMNEYESPYDCARRELLEETGYIAQDWTRLGTLYREPHYSPTVIHIWLARALAKTGTVKLDETEELVSDILTPQDISDRIAWGEMCSVYCVAAWGMVKGYLE